MNPIQSNSAEINSQRIQAQLEMRQSLNRTNQAALDSMPENTKKAYEPKIQEFRNWCDTVFQSEPVEMRYIVNGEKAHFFLDDAVAGRLSRSKRKRTEGEEVPVKKIKFSTLDQYGAALVSLWNYQRMMKINSHPHPRLTFAPLLQNIKREEEETKLSNCDDRGVGTIMDGYTTTDQIASITAFYFEKKTVKDLRNSLSFLLSHFCLLRGESARKAEFPDLQVVNIEGEGSGTCPALVLVMRQGKPNKFGRLEIGACLRNARVEICPFMMLGTYLFARFHLEGEPFPNFEQSRNWFRTKLLKHTQDSTKEWTYHSHLNAIDQAFKACRITSSKKTHVCRGSSARMADLQGVNESDIRRMGRWNNSSMNGAYLTGLPRGMMRSLAGFPQQGTFHLARNATVPSESLQAKVFPEASMWLSKIHEGHAEQTVSAEGFLNLLLVLRVTFLQDSVFMQRLFPGHPLWKHELFVDPEYIAFKRQLEASSQADENRDDITLQRIVPLIERKLANMEDQQRIFYEQLAEMMKTLLSNVSDISTGRAPLQINIEWPQGSNTLANSIIRTAVNGSASTSSPSSFTTTDTTQTTPESSSAANTTTVSFRLSRNVPTITDLYREWTVGLGGGHSIMYMNLNHPGWYNSEKSFYMRRRKNIKTCEEYAALEGITVQDAVNLAENNRARSGKSLDYLSKHSSEIFS